MAALDGQTLEGQGPEVYAMFGGDSARWEAEHNAALLASGWGQQSAYVPPPATGAQVWSGQQNLPPRQNPVQVSPGGAVTYVDSGTTYQPPQAMQSPEFGGNYLTNLAADRLALDVDRHAEDVRRAKAAEEAKRVYDAWYMRYQDDQLAFAKAQQAYRQQYDADLLAFERQKAGDQTALSVLNLGASLRGPQNYLSYLRTFGGLTGGLKDVVNSLAGRFQLSPQQSTVPGATYERASLAGMLRDINAPTAAAGAKDASGAELPSGGQWNAANVRALQANPTAWGLTQNLYDESGRDFNTEYAAFLSSLPRFGGPRSATVRL